MATMVPGAVSTSNPCDAMPTLAAPSDITARLRDNQGSVRRLAAAAQRLARRRHRRAGDATTIPRGPIIRLARAPPSTGSTASTATKTGCCGSASRPAPPGTRLGREPCVDWRDLPPPDGYPGSPDEIRKISRRSQPTGCLLRRHLHQRRGRPRTRPQHSHRTTSAINAKVHVTNELIDEALAVMAKIAAGAGTKTLT